MSLVGRFAVVALGITVSAAAIAAAQEEGGFSAVPLEPTQTLDGVKSHAGLVSVLVKFDADAVAKYRGGVQGLAPTSPQVTGARIQRSAPSVQAYESFLAAKETQFGAELQRRVPRGRIVHRLRMVFGGVSVVLPRDQVAELARMPGVRAVYPDVPLPLDTDRSTEFIGAPELWADVGGKGKAGEGIVVGILDSGIWPESPSVQDDGSFPPPPAKWTGTACEFGSGTLGDDPFSCDNKLIGARRMMSTFDLFGPAPLAGEFYSARDNNGHGSHTATTAAGNSDVDADFQGSPLGVISGVAPRAHLSVYKVCFTASDGQGSCYSSDSAAAVQQAIIDGVDVLNFSVGGGTDPYADAVSLAFLDAYAAGVFVACSAGNSGPGLDTVGHREPWTTTAAATTTDKLYEGSAAVSASSGASLDVTGASSFDGVVPPAPVVLASAVGSYADALCLNPAAPGTFDGQIVVCERGTIARVAKSANVAAGGAVGMIFYNPAPEQSLNADIHSVPTVHIDDVQGAALVAFLTAESDSYGSITGVRSLDGQGDVLAAFSSRGGPGQTLGISKPDVAAPGVDILAGVSGKLAVPVGPDGQLWDIYSGTSMASPHVAGAGALLKQLHPDWGPGEIKSALMMTAAAVVKEDAVTPATPFDVGSGRIDLTRAGDPGLLISETAENFAAYQSNLSWANLPSLYLPVMPGKVAVPRTIVNTLEKRHRCDEWKVSVEAPSDVRIRVPHRLSFRWKDARDIWISVDASRVPLGEVRHARILFKHRQDHDRRHHRKRHHKSEWEVLSFPVTLVRQQGGTTLTKTCDETELSIGDETHCTIAATNTTFEPANVVVTNKLPRELRLKSVSGADQVGWRRVRFEGPLAPAEPPDVGIAPDPGGTPAGGYLPLSQFGIAPVGGLGDETIVNFTVPPFLFAGQVYTRIGAVSNGYAVVGGGTAADVQYINQDFPDPAAPNNVLAPFWTDLDFNKGGELRAGVLGGGGLSWLVLDWEAVHVYTAGDGMLNSFQIWIQLGGAVEDITFTYGEVGVGDYGYLTVGAENLFGNRGSSYYVDGIGSAPEVGTELRVSGAPGAPGETHEIEFSARARHRGHWLDCAEMDSDAVFGTTTSCVAGKVSGRHWHRR